MEILTAFLREHSRKPSETSRMQNDAREADAAQAAPPSNRRPVGSEPLYGPRAAGGIRFGPKRRLQVARGGDAPHVTAHLVDRGPLLYLTRPSPACEVACN